MSDARPGRLIGHCRRGLLGLGLVAGSVWAGSGVESYCEPLKWVVLAPAGSSAVQVVDVSRGVTPLATLRSPRRARLLAVHVDSATRRVWVLASNGLDVHDAYNGRVLGHWDFPSGVAPDRLGGAGAGSPEVWAGARRFRPLVGAALLVPADTRVSWR